MAQLLSRLDVHLDAEIYFADLSFSTSCIRLFVWDHWRLTKLVLVHVCLSTTLIVDCIRLLHSLLYLLVLFQDLLDLALITIITEDLIEDDRVFGALLLVLDDPLLILSSWSLLSTFGAVVLGNLRPRSIGILIHFKGKLILGVFLFCVPLMMGDALVHEVDWTFDLFSILIFKLIQVDAWDDLFLLLLVFVKFSGKVTLEVTCSLLDFKKHRLADAIVIVVGLVFLLLCDFDLLDFILGVLQALPAI